MSLLSVEDLRAGYGKIPILHGVTFHIDESEIVAIVGPNGAGKSTLLKSITGLLKPTSGKILFQGTDWAGSAPHALARNGISYVPEGSRLFANMTVRENIFMGAFTKRDALKTGILDEIYGMFPILKERDRQFARTLSGGEKQMLAISRGLVSRPRILMLDEPSLGIAPKLIDEIYEKLHVLKETGLTVLLVEQNTYYALDLADRGYVLENGRIVLEGSGQELADNPHVKKSYLGL